MSDKNQVAIRDTATLPIPVNSMADIVNVGELVAKSQMFGEITASVGTMIALTMYQERISPLDFTRRYHVIDGKVTKRADATLAEFAMRGGKYKIIRADAECVNIEFTYNGNTVNGKMTIGDAKTSGIAIGKGGDLKKNWQRFPQQMLFARVVTNSVRMVMPEIVCGIYSPEEAAEFNDAKEVAIDNAPKQIKVEDVSSRVSKTDPEAIEVDVVDYDTCPIKKGNLFGVKWSDMPADILSCAIKVNRTKYPEMTDEHIARAQYILNKMEEEAMEIENAN